MSGEDLRHGKLHGHLLWEPATGHLVYHCVPATQTPTSTPTPSPTGCDTGYSASCDDSDPAQPDDIILRIPPGGVNIVFNWPSILGFTTVHLHGGDYAGSKQGLVSCRWEGVGIIYDGNDDIGDPSSETRVDWLVDYIPSTCVYMISFLLQTGISDDIVFATFAGNTFFYKRVGTTVIGFYDGSVRIL